MARTLISLLLALLLGHEARQNPTFWGVNQPPSGGGGSNNISVINGCAKNYPTATNSFALIIGSTGTCANSGLNPVVGHLILVVVFLNSTTSGFTVSDSGSNTWTTQTCGSGIVGYGWSTLTTGGNLTVTASTTSNNAAIILSFDITGQIGYSTGGNPFDNGLSTVNCNLFSASTTWAASSVATINANDVMYSCTGTFAGTPSIGAALNGFTDLNGAGGTGQVAECGYLKTTTTGTYSGGYSVSPSTSYHSITFGIKSS